MIKTFTLTSVLLLGGCATFNLGYVQSQPGHTSDQQQLATLTCKDEAHLAASSNGDVAKGFLLGLTIVGTPVAIAMDRAKQRKVFTNCMQDKGYTVNPAT
jgi:hypothetical protein